MKKIFLASLSILLLFILSSCSSPQPRDMIDVEDHLRFKLGMTMEELDATFKHDLEVKIFELTEIKNKNVIVKAYSTDAKLVSLVVFFAFVDNQLLYWGYPYEFNRHGDPFVNEIGMIAFSRNNNKW